MVVVAETKALRTHLERRIRFVLRFATKDTKSERGAQREE
jgi:hypothetical protein